MQFVESRAKARETAEDWKVIYCPVPWQGISCTPGCPHCPLNTDFPHVLLSRNAVRLVRVLLAAAPGAVLRRVLSNTLFAAISGKAILMFSLPLLVPFPSPHQKVPPFPTAQSPPPPLSFLQVVR